MRKIIIVLMCIGILVSWQICKSDLANAGHKGSKCSIAGTWYAAFGDGSEPGIVTIVPLDPEGHRFAISWENPKPLDPTFNDFFSDATRLTDYRGTVIRDGKQRFKNSSYAFGVDENWSTVWEVFISEIMKLTDCDHFVSSGSANFVFDGGSICIPYTIIGKRLEMVEPCDDFPPFPDSE